MKLTVIIIIICRGFNFAVVVNNYTSGMMVTGKKPVKSLCEVRLNSIQEIRIFEGREFFLLFISWGLMRLSPFGV
jgi:hypothetical protein